MEILLQLDKVNIIMTSAVKTSQLSADYIFNRQTDYLVFVDIGDLSQGSSGSTKRGPISALDTSVWSVSSNYNIQKINPVYTTVNSNSAGWNNTYTTVNSNSSTWNSNTSSSKIELPTWTFTSGSMDVGKFTANDPIITSATLLSFSKFSKNNGTDFTNIFQNIRGGNRLVMTGLSGTYIFECSVGTFDTDHINFTVSPISNPSDTWFGDFSVTLWSPQYMISHINGDSGDINGNVTLDSSDVGAIPTIGTSMAIQKGNGNGILIDAIPGTDYLYINSDGSQLTGITPTQVGAATSFQGSEADEAKSVTDSLIGITGIVKCASSVLAAAVDGSDFIAPTGDISDTHGVNSDISDAIASAITAMLSDSTTLASILAAASVIPVSDDTNIISGSLGGSVVTKNGIIQSWTQAT